MPLGFSFEFSLRCHHDGKRIGKSFCKNWVLVRSLLRVFCLSRMGDSCSNDLGLVVVTAGGLLCIHMVSPLKILECRIKDLFWTEWVCYM